MQRVTLPISKPAWGIAGITLELDADPETGVVAITYKGGPVGGRTTIQPEDLVKLGEQLAAEGRRGLSYQAACVGPQQCGTCRHYLPRTNEVTGKVSAVAGHCYLSCFDEVAVDRTACARWEPGA